MNRIKAIVYPIVLAAILVSGAEYVSAWVGPSATPPSRNVSAPVNVGSVTQTKTGSLGLSGLAVFGTSVFSGGVKITDGTQGVNKVFTSDTEGNGTWQALPATCLN